MGCRRPTAITINTAAATRASSSSEKERGGSPEGGGGNSSTKTEGRLRSSTTGAGMWRWLYGPWTRTK